MVSVQNDSGRNSLIVSIALSRPVAERLEETDLGSALTLSLQTMLQELGIPGLPQVEISTSDEVNPHLLFETSVNGLPCHYSEDLLRYIAYYIRGVYLEQPFTADKLKEETPQTLASILHSLCVAALLRNPAVLLTPVAVEMYRELLIKQFGDAGLPTANSLHSILSEVLKLGISIGNTKIVASVLDEAFKTKKSTLWTIEELIAALRPDEIQIQVPREYLREFTVNTGSTEQELFKLMRDGLFYELGLHFPNIRFIESEDAEPRSIRIRINNLTMPPWRGLKADELLVNDTVDRLELIVTEINGTPSVNPANGKLSAIIGAADLQKAEQAGLTTWTPLAYLILIMSQELRTHASQFLDLRRAQLLLDELKLYFPELVTVALARFSVEQITATLRLLLAESISIRNLRQILQALVDFNHIEIDSGQYIVFAPWLPFRERPNEEELSDPVNLAAHVRSTMKAYLSHKYTVGKSTLIVALLAPEIEGWLSGHRSLAKGPPREDEIHECGRILDAVVKDIADVWQKPAILTTIEVRQALREIIAPTLPQVPVLSYQELSPELNIQPLVRISWD